MDALITRQSFGPPRLFLCVLIVVLIICPLGVVSFGDTNTIPWNDNFENYTNLTPLINGTQGWFASSSGCIVQQDVKYSGSQAAMLPVDVTLSNRFSNSFTRIVRVDMQIQPQLYDGSTAPTAATNVAAQFYVNSNGYFVVCNGTNWRTLDTLAGGGSALPITNTHFTRVELNLRYKNHTWNLKAWSNTTLMASAPYVNFTSNLNSFSGFDIYNGNSTSYVDAVVVSNVTRLNKINGVRMDAVYRIDGAQPGVVNGVTE